MEDENGKKKIIVIAAGVIIAIILIIVLVITLKKPKEIENNTPTLEYDNNCPLLSYSDDMGDGLLHCWYDNVAVEDAAEYQNNGYECEKMSNSDVYYCEIDIDLNNPNSDNDLEDDNENNDLEDNSSSNEEENSQNPQTGTTLMAIIWFIGIFTIGYSINYFSKLTE